MTNLRMAAVGRILQGDIIIVSPELETGIVLDPTHVPDWPDFLAHAAQAEHLEDTLEYEDDILDREYHARGQW